MGHGLETAGGMEEWGALKKGEPVSLEIKPTQNAAQGGSQQRPDPAAQLQVAEVTGLQHGPSSLQDPTWFLQMWRHPSKFP